MPAHTVAVVPLRALGVGKSRLALRLTPEQRATLARAMFRDVIASLTASPVDEVVVAAGDDDAARLAAELGLRAQVDPPGATTLDGALQAAQALLPPATGCLLVVTADLPCVRPPDIAAVVAGDAPIVIAPTEDGGTGALLRRPPDAMATSYGPGSARRHQELATRTGLVPRVVTTEGLRHDVDTWADLIALQTSDVGEHTRAVLPELLAVV